MPNGRERKEMLHVLITHVQDYLIEKKDGIFLTEEEESKGERGREEEQKEKKSRYINRRNTKNICSGSTLHTRQHYRPVRCVSLCSRACLLIMKSHLLYVIYLRLHRVNFSIPSAHFEEREIC